jgi:drug efflux transport system ATP-binding protein
MNDSPPTITVSGLTKRFQNVPAAENLSFTVEKGEIFGLVGPDGSGKTTVMRMLAGVMAPDKGSATVAGFDVVRDPEAVKKHISYMPQRFGLYEDLTVEENIRFYADLFGVDAKRRETQAARLLAASGMSEFRKRLARKLSGGMKQKLGLTCALIHRPRVILLDEPTTGVDPISRREFWRILYSLLAEGVTILTTTAYLDEAERCHHLALLHRGRLLFGGTPTELKRALPGAVVSIPSPEPRSLQKELTGADGVFSLVTMGDRVHLVVDDSARRIPQLRARLEAVGLPFEEIIEVSPTIEDVFVSTIQRGESDAGSAAAASGTG